MTGAQGKDTSVLHHTRSSAAVVLLAITSLLLPLLPAEAAAGTARPGQFPAGTSSASEPEDGAAAPQGPGPGSNGAERVLVHLDLHIGAAVGVQGHGGLAEAAALAQSQVEGTLPPEATITHEFPGRPHMVVEIPADRMATLGAVPGVANVAAAVEVAPSLESSVPAIGTRADGEGTDDLTVAGQTLTGADTSIAVIDTGVLSTHAMFTDRIREEACFVTGPDGSGECPNDETVQFGEGAAAPLPSGNTHGSHVSGIALGSEVNGQRGVAPEAGLVAIQTFRETVTDDGRIAATANSADLTAAMEWLVTEVAAGRLPDLRAVNLSLGTAATTSCNASHAWNGFSSAVDDLRQAGVMTIAATGNDGEAGATSEPGCLDNVVSVAANSTETPDSLASFSNIDTTTDLAAPGQTRAGFGIFSAGTSAVDAFVRSRGTSMAAPHVAGAVSVLASAAPHASVEQLLDALTGPGVPTLTVLGDVQLPRLDLRAAALGLPGADGAPPTPTVTASTVPEGSDGTIRVAFEGTADAGVTYHVVAAPGGRWCEAPGSADMTAFNCEVDGLINGQAYTATVTATDEQGRTSTASAPSDEATPLGVPGAPIDLLAVPSTDGVALTWFPPADGGSPITGYDVTVTPTGETASVTELPATATSTEITGLAQDTTHEVAVVASNDRGDGPAATRTFQTGSPLASPTTVTATATTVNGQLRIEWSSVADATDYEASARLGAEPPAASCSTTGALSCVIDGLQDGEGYEVVVRASNENGSGPVSAPVTGTPVGPPLQPLAVEATVSDEKVTVTWSPPAVDGGSAITGYDVTAKPDGGHPLAPRTPDPATATSLTFDDLGLGSQYTFEVRASNTIGTGPASEASPPVLAAGVPATPTITSVEQVTDELAVAVTWSVDDRGAEITSTQLEISDGDGFVATDTVSGAATTATIGDLPADVELTLVVTAANALGSGPASDPFVIAPLTAPEPPPPLGGGGGGGGGGGAPPPDPDDDEEPEETPDDGADPVTDADGSLPAPDAGSTELVIDGSPSTTSASNTITEVAVSGGEVTATLSADDGNGTSSPVRDGTLSLPPGGRVNLGVSGLTPGSTSTAWLFSDPVRLGSLTVGSDGSLSGGVDVPAGVPAGRHTLQLVLERADGTPLALSIGVQVAQIEGRFPDVRVPSTHWLAIERIADLRITLGATDGTYRPGDPVTRGQMAAFLDRQLGLPAVPGDTEVALSDIAGTQHEAAIERLVAAGIAGGFTDGTYRPNEPVLRGQLATFLQAAAELAPLASGPATDVAGSTHEQAIHAVMAAEIAGGFTDGTYRPREDVSRAQMATLLVGLEAFLAESAAS